MARSSRSIASRTGLLLSLLAAGALTVEAAKPRVDYDTEYDFEGKTSFAWSNESIPVPSELIQQRIEVAVTDSLGEKGVGPAVEGTAPDYVVLLESYADTRVRSRTRVGIGIGKGVGSGGVSVGGSRSVGTKTVRIGTLVVQIIDRETGALVWEAEMSDKISGEAEDIDKQVRRSVERAFKKFPPKQRKRKK